MGSTWRLVREKFSPSAFSGEGSAKYGGRWNSPQNRVVYTSATLSLAALEYLVHLGSEMSFRYLAFEVQFDDSLVQTLTLAKLPETWRNHPLSLQAQRMGDSWLNASKSPILAVPSVIVPLEFNYLLNPLHKKFDQLEIKSAQPFAFDPRLL